MAIQFRCPGCSQPIEVDDVHAGQTASCPYCHRVVKVPAESCLDQETPAAARPAGDAAGVEGAPESDSEAAGPPGTQPPHYPPPGPYRASLVGSTREQTARTFGNYALICTALALLLFVVVAVYAFTIGMKYGLANPQSQPFEEQRAKFEAELTGNTWIGAANIGALFFGCAGLALGITSLVQSRRGNWRGTLSVVVCAMFMLCICLAATVALAGGGLPT